MRFFIALGVLVSLATSIPVFAASCPAAEHLPQLTIDKVQDPAVPVIDSWQIFLGDVPLSDAQLAQFARDDRLIDRTRAEMEDRGRWVYLTMGMTAFGTALSSAGWVLYGQNEIKIGGSKQSGQVVTLSMAVSGLLLGVAGLLAVSESIQTPLEPHLAPTPVHRLTREEARDLVARVNRRLYEEICSASDATSAKVSP